MDDSTDEQLIEQFFSYNSSDADYAELSGISDSTDCLELQDERNDITEKISDDSNSAGLQLCDKLNDSTDEQMMEQSFSHNSSDVDYAEFSGISDSTECLEPREERNEINEKISDDSNSADLQQYDKMDDSTEGKMMEQSSSQNSSDADYAEFSGISDSPDYLEAQVERNEKNVKLSDDSNSADLQLHDKMNASTDEETMDKYVDSDSTEAFYGSQSVIEKSIEHLEPQVERSEKHAKSVVDMNSDNSKQFHEMDDLMDKVIEQHCKDDAYDALCVAHSEITKLDSRQSNAEIREKHKKRSVVLEQAELRALKSSYGSDVSSYLENSDVIDKKTKTGAYIILKEECFNECRRRFEAHYKQSLKAIENVVEEKIDKPAAKPQANCYDSPVNFRRIVNDDRANTRSKTDTVEAKPFCATSEVATSLIVSFEDCYHKGNKIDWLVISHRRKRSLTCQWDYDLVFRLMMETQIGSEKMINYRSCVDQIIPILKEFHRKHEKFDYFYELRHILNIKKIRQCHKPLPVTLHQFQKYFSRIFFAVIPFSLFGNYRNVKKLRKALKQYFVVSFKDKISLTSFVHRMDISCITWLRPIKDEATRWSVIAKVTKWIFEKYLSAILKAVFSIQKSLHSEKKVFISSEYWIMTKHQYIQREEKKGAIMKFSSNSNTLKLSPVPSGQMTLIPKTTGVRPIYHIQYDTSRAQLTLLQSLLQQCYFARYERTRVNDLHSLWRSYATRREGRANRELYLVACDVLDAYGSIIQSKLFDIISAMIIAIPEDKLRIQWYSILVRPRWGREIKLNYKRWFSGCSESPAIRPRSILRPIQDSEHVTQYIEKETMLSIIKDYIFNQTFQFNNTRYIQKQGVVQGSRLSPILADIYYAHMRDQEFHSFIKSGTIFRFVDDFLYISEDEDQAKGFLKTVSKSIPEYNCGFKVSKTQTNVRSSHCKQSTSIVYLGYRINGTTLDVHPELDNNSFRYSKWLRRVYQPNSVKLFFSRLNNKVALKLNDIVLDNKINSVRALTETAGLIAYTMASRCVYFISTIFKNMSGFSEVIMQTIRSSVTKLSEMFKRHLRLRGSHEWNPVMRSILISIWKSFLRVFTRSIELRKHYCKDIKLTIKILKAY